MTKSDKWSWHSRDYEYNPSSLDQKEEAGTDNEQDWASVMLVVLVVPITATVSVLRLWFEPPFAWGISTFVWTLMGYWLPSKPRISYSKWIVFSLLFALGTSFLAAVLETN